MKEHAFTRLPVKNGEVWWDGELRKARLLCKGELQELRGVRSGVARTCAQRLEKNGRPRRSKVPGDIRTHGEIGRGAASWPHVPGRRSG